MRSALSNCEIAAYVSPIVILSRISASGLLRSVPASIFVAASSMSSRRIAVSRPSAAKARHRRAGPVHKRDGHLGLLALERLRAARALGTDQPDARAEHPAPAPRPTAQRPAPPLCTVARTCAACTPCWRDRRHGLTGEVPLQVAARSLAVSNRRARSFSGTSSRSSPVSPRTALLSLPGSVRRLAATLGRSPACSGGCWDAAARPRG